MQEFDPRHQPSRYGPRALVCLAGCAALALSWQLTVHNPQPESSAAALDPAAVAALQNKAFAEAEAQPGFSRPEKVAMTIAPGETFEQAVLRLGVPADEAHQAVSALGKAFDTVNIKAGLAFEAAVARPRDRRGPVRLIGLSMRADPTRTITLSRTFDGALRLREMEEQVRGETTVACGKMEGSLYESATSAGATPEIVAQAVKLFSHKFDFARDIHPGDKFCLVFDRKLTESGRTVEAGDLKFAEVKGSRFYRFQPPGDSEAQFFDQLGKNIRGLLLRTPLAVVRITSGFGMRLHPLLGYTRMHAGIDFGAPIGTPVYAAGDGVVEEARWAGGYGRWLKIRHNAQWETGYGHLSGWAVKPGQHVRQGQVVAYTGSTGESTGPHLHYEVILNGKKINPKGAKVPQGTILEGRELAMFKAQEARVDGLLKTAGEGDVRLAQADEPTASQLALRSGEEASEGGGRSSLRRSLR